MFAIVATIQSVLILNIFFLEQLKTIKMIVLKRKDTLLEIITGRYFILSVLLLEEIITGRANFQKKSFAEISIFCTIILNLRQEEFILEDTLTQNEMHEAKRMEVQNLLPKKSLKLENNIRLISLLSENSQRFIGLVKVSLVLLL